jgi:hypothetical protein
MSSALSVSRLVSNKSNLHYHDNRKDHYYIKSQSLKERIEEIKDFMNDDCKHEKTNDCNEHYTNQIDNLQKKLDKSNINYYYHMAKYRKIQQILARQGKTTTSNKGGKPVKQRKHKKRKTAKRQKRSS